MAQTPEVATCAEIRDGMRITWHQAIPMDDGIVSSAIAPARMKRLTPAAIWL